MFDRPFVSIADVIATHAKYRGAQPALICGKQTRTWREFDNGVTRVANALLSKGLTKGDRVAVIAASNIATIEALFGIIRAGGVTVPLSAFVGPETLALMLDDSGSKFLIADEAYQSLAHATAEAAKKFPTSGRLAIDFVAPGFRPLFSITETANDFPVMAPYDPMTIVYSSGTTGVPKGIVHAHLMRFLLALTLGTEFRMDATSKAILATPLYSNGTWMTLLPVAYAGATAIVLERYTAEGFLKAVEIGGTHAFLVPTQIRGILDQLMTRSYDISALRMIVSAGSAMPRTWKHEAMEIFRGRLMELYGLTEGVATTLHAEDIERKTDSVGTPLPGIDLRILDGEDKEGPVGTIGEIVGYGSGLMLGYHNRPEATASAIWRDDKGRTFLRTGDIGRFDEDGFLYILDRKKDMIVSGGVNVFASDIEQVLHGHPAVKDVAVIGVPDAKWVETPIALIIGEPGAARDGEAIRNWANAKLGKYQQISRIEFFDTDFPRNALGKVLKAKLRETYR